MIDSNWIEAVKLPTRVLAGLLLASILMLFADWLGVVALKELWDFARPFLVLCVILFGSLTLTSAIALLVEGRKSKKKQELLVSRQRLRQQGEEEQIKKAQAASLARLDHLAPEELDHLAGALRKGSQSFYTYVHSPSVTTLGGKGLVYTPGGVHNQDHYPFTIHDFVWKELLDRKEEFLAKDEDNKQATEQRRKMNRGY